MKRKVILATVSILVITGLMLGLGACATEPAPTAPSSGAPKTLKAGLILALNWPLGPDWVQGTQFDIDLANAEGGLLIGGERYKIETVVDDHKMDPGLVKTAAEKQVHQDKVNLILSDSWAVPIFAISEPNKVIVVASPETPEIYSPNNKYTSQGYVSGSDFVALLGWAAENLKDKKTIVGIFPDRLDGHAYNELYKKAATAYGLTWLEPIFYPPTATDLSAVGTKVKSMTPDMFVAHGGGPDVDSEVAKAIYNSGCRAQNLDCSTTRAAELLAIAGPEITEGMIALAHDTEFVPVRNNPYGEEWMTAYRAKYGLPLGQEGFVVLSGMWWQYKTAVQKAGSIDPDKVAAVIGNGLEYASPFYTQAKMFSRPDLGNNRTVDLAVNVAVKQVVNGQVKVLDDLTADDIIKIMSKVHGF